MNVYENQQADLRQSQTEQEAPADRVEQLFRPRYRQLTGEEIALHDEIKAKAAALANAIYKITDPYEKLLATQIQPKSVIDKIEDQAENVSRAIAHIEDAVYRAVKALTR